MKPVRLMNLWIRNNELKYSEVKAGVYKLIHCNTGKIYVGSTSDIYKRIHSHTAHLFKGTHPNSNLQKHFDESREFELEFIEYPRSEKLQRIHEEQKLLDLLFPQGILLNIAKDAVAPWRGIPMNKKTAEAIRKASVGRIKTREEIEKIRQAHLGKKYSQETIEKCALWLQTDRRCP